MRRPGPRARAAPALAVLAVLAAGCGAEGEPKSAAPPAPVIERALAGAPPPLARLHGQANRLLAGGPKAFRARLAELRGHPVVVNKWASWCAPCRAEFPFLQRQSLEHGKRVAFIGVNSTDDDAAARRFLERFPVSYPSYRDPDGEVARAFGGDVGFPTTAFYDARGRVTLKQGGYAAERLLAADIERYALRGRPAR